jgi:hypothetical protein
LEVVVQEHPQDHLNQEVQQVLIRQHLDLHRLVVVQRVVVITVDLL